MIHIELIGCTSAGKSTVADGIVQACGEQGIDILTSNDLVLRQLRLQWINNRLGRTFWIDLVSLSACLLTCRHHVAFYAFAVPVIFRLPVPWFEKLNLARNVLKKIGIYEIIRARGTRQQIILVDEGTLQAAHNLFVHVAVAPNPADVVAFAGLVPRPDVAVYVRQSEPVLIDRTLERGHKRIPGRSRAAVERFIKRAVDTFDTLAQQSSLKDRLLVVDSQRKLVVGQQHPSDPSIIIVLELLRAIVDTSEHSPAGIPSQSYSST